MSACLRLLAKVIAAPRVTSVSVAYSTKNGGDNAILRKHHAGGRGRRCGLRIGMMLDKYKTYISGVTHYVTLNKRVLEAQGHNVFVFTFGGDEHKDDELHVVRSPGLPLSVKDTGISINLRYSRSAQGKVRSMDVVHVQHPFLSGQLALRYARARGVPVIFTNHT